MKSHGPLAAFLATVVAFAPGAAADELPIDEEAIVAEMEALVDATPDLDERTHERVKSLRQKGIKAHDENQFEKAIGFYRRALEINPLAYDVYYELAHTYATIGDRTQALDAVTRALILNPKAELSYVLRASVLDDLGFRDEAEAAYRKLLEIQPSSYLGHLNLGITLFRAGEWERAEAAYLRAIDVQPDHPSGYFHMALLCKTLDYNYDERKYLEKFLEVGAADHRIETVKQRMEELQQHELQVDPNHPHASINMTEKFARVAWRSGLHEKRFPQARGYELTFDEDRDVYTTILPMWRAKKKEDPSAAYGPYDLLVRIDDAGFLDEYIWYHRQKVFGDRATAWMEEHRDRMDAFVEWAKAEGLMKEEEDGQPADTSPLDRFRGVPGDLFRLVEESAIVYEAGVETGRPGGLLEDERERFARTLELSGEDRVACRKAARRLHDEVPKIGVAALVPVFRCFVPGESGYEQGIGRAASLGLEAREIQFRPAAELVLGEKVQLNGEGAWLFYALAKGAWRREAQIRESNGGPEDGDRASLNEEIFALGVTVGAYVNILEPDEPEEPSGEVREEREDEAVIPPESTPSLDRLLEAIRADHFRGYVLYEVIHKAYRLPLDRLSEDDAQAVSDYLFGHVLFRTQSE